MEELDEEELLEEELDEGATMMSTGTVGTGIETDAGPLMATNALRVAQRADWRERWSASERS